MIFVTVGTQLPFDRMIRVVDEWAGRCGRKDVFAQIGPGSYIPKHVEHATFISPSECSTRMREASVLVAHAGMGSILTALEIGTPIIIMPRRAGLGEHRNDHQLATARRFAALGKVRVAMDESELPAALDSVGDVKVGERISPFASPRLLAAVKGFVHGGSGAARADGVSA